MHFYSVMLWGETLPVLRNKNVLLPQTSHKCLFLNPRLHTADTSCGPNDEHTLFNILISVEGRIIAVCLRCVSGRFPYKAERKVCVC